MFTLAAAAYNLVRIRNLQAANVSGEVCPKANKRPSGQPNVRKISKVRFLGPSFSDLSPLLCKVYCETPLFITLFLEGNVATLDTYAESVRMMRSKPDLNLGTRACLNTKY